MGYTARPFWMLLFLLVFLFIGAAMYYAWGEHLSTMFDYREMRMNGEISEQEMNLMIAPLEKEMSENLARGMPTTKVVMMIPSVLFLIWLAVTPGKTDKS